MKITQLLDLIAEKNINVSVEDGQLKIRAPRGVLDKHLTSLLKTHKDELLQALSKPVKITPELLTLVDLEQAEIDNIVATVAGGAANVQDIYPLAPLQEGILFHHLLQAEGDTFIISDLLSFNSEEQFNSFVSALNKVIARHDILRTAVLWQNLNEPVQVVWKKAELTIEKCDFSTADNKLSVEAHLLAYASPQKMKIEVSKAPMFRGFATFDQKNQRWLLQLLHHHLIMDNTTLELMIEEVMLFQQGREAELSKPVPFRNFVAQARLGMTKEEHQIFFKEMLAGIDEPTAPFGLLDVQGNGTEVTESTLAIETNLADKIRQQATQHGVSTASLFHLAWAQVLAKTSGREDVVFGTLLFGRFQGGEDAALAMGMFVNTLPVRIKLADSFVKTSLKDTHLALTNLLKHESASLALAQQCSELPATTPLFSALLNCRRSNENNSDTDLHDGVELLRGEERTNYPFNLSVDDSGDGFFLTAQIDKSVAAERICQFMQVTLENIVTALANETETLMQNISIMPKGEYEQVIDVFNDTQQDFPQGMLIQELFEQQVIKNPDVIALVFKEQSLSYAQLNIRANQMAHHLIKLGVKPDDRVALCVDRSIEMVIAILAILKAGGAYVPMDPNYPTERLAHMMQDSAPVALLTTSSLIEQITLTEACTLVILDEILELQNITHGHTDNNINRNDIYLNNNNLAYVIYTSGSTGKPKGVMVEHSGVINLAYAQSQAFQIDADSRLLQFASVSFDAFISELTTVLLQGASLYIPVSTQQLTGYQLNDFVEEHQITHATIPPVVLAQMPDDAHLRSISTLITAGEASTERLVQRWSKGRRLLNAYGPTETSVCATIYECNSAELGAPAIGQPIANSQIYILDQYQQPVPTGVAGEIYIGGAGIARGYLNQEKLTKTLFLDNPFLSSTLSSASPRMYRTGDLAKWREDGAVIYLGRNDFQVKIRGFRIELDEIAAQLSALPNIDESVVIVREDQPGNKRIVAYIVAGEDFLNSNTLDPIILREHLSRFLPDYMIPAAYVSLTALPVTPNGKLDKKALPAPEDDAYAQLAYQVPQGEVEVCLAQIWSELLKVKRVGRLDNFFELGGHSLLAIQLISKLRQRLDIELPLATLFDHPNLIDLAQQVTMADHHTLVDITIADRDMPLALSYAQQRLWFIEQLDKNASAAYHMPIGLRLTGILKANVLVAALDKIVERHEILRTHFVSIAGKPQQIIEPATGFSLQYQDLSDASVEECTLAYEQEALAPFDFDTGPLIRGRLLRLNTEEHVLLITMHHIISDGWSMGILTQELVALYAAFSEDRPDPLPALTLQYADFSQWQHQYLQGELLEKQKEYWLDNLKGAPELVSLPLDRPRPEIQDYTGDSIKLVLEIDVSRRLKALSQAHGTTLYTVILAAWAAVISRLSSQDDIVIGTPNANRTRAELESLIGFFINTQAMRVKVPADLTVEQLLAQVKETSLAALSHQDIQFEQIVDAVNPIRSQSHSPIFQLMFTWQNTPEDDEEFGELNVESIDANDRSAQFDLSLTLEEHDQQIVGSFGFATAIFDQETIERHWGYLKAMLTAMVNSDTQQVGMIPLMSAQERIQVVKTFNNTDKTFPQDKLIHQLFEQQVVLTPNAIAIEFNGEVLTYLQLNERANQLARHLIDLGVKPDDCVALCLERSLEMVISIYAVIKAGGAYVPMDPEHPKDRLAHMVTDSAPMIVLTQSVIVERLSDIAKCPIIVLDEMPWQFSVWANNVASNLVAESIGLHNTNLAYVIYTSGSTGLPKGVMVEHKSLVNRIDWMQQEYQLQASENVLQKTPFSFDVSVWEFFWPLCYGAKLVLADPQGHKDPLYLAQLINEKHISTLHFVPSMLQAFLVQQPQCQSLKRVICSGEALPLNIVIAAKELWPQAELHNLYGPTEATIDVTAWTCSVKDQKIPIGYPIANTQMYILDALQQPVPLGVSGEIFIGGVGVARGYLNNMSLTKDRFVTDPFATTHTKMYKTGDLGRWLPNGAIEYLGRNDFQIKLRGFRIELGEIEAQLSRINGVREVAVIAREDTPGNQQLVAYIVVDVINDDVDDGIDKLNIDILREALSASLPEYMIPAAYIMMASLPLTLNGKLDRKALPAPDEGAFSSQVYEAPQGDVEIVLASIWAELLNVEIAHVGRLDSFFALGGHSLLMVQLVERLRAHDWFVKISDLFSQANLQAMAQAIVVAKQQGVSEVVVPVNAIPEYCLEITPEMLPLVTLNTEQIEHITAAVVGGAGNIQDIYPLAPLQEGILFHHMLQSIGDTYLTYTLLSFNNEQQLQQFAVNLNKVIARHDILRTAVHWENLDVPVQVVWKKTTFALEVVNFSAGNTVGNEINDVESQLLAYADKQSFKLDINQAPMFRGIAAYDKGSKRWLLKFLFHHMIIDHTTLELMLEEVSLIDQGRDNELSTPVPFRNFVAQIGLGKNKADHQEFFTKMLSDVTEPTTPFGLLDVQADGSKVIEYELELDNVLATKIRQQAKIQEVSAASLFHLAWAQVLAKTTGREDVVFGTVLFGRFQAGAGADRAMGMFINTLPFRINMLDCSVKQSLKNTYFDLTQLLDHEHASLALAQNCSALSASAPLFSALLNYRYSEDSSNQSEHESANEGDYEGIRELTGEERSNYPFDLSVDDFGDGFCLTAQIDKSVCAKRVCTMMKISLESLIAALESKTDVLMRNIDIMSTQEKSVQLSNFNSPSVKYPGSVSIQGRFESQVLKVPEAIAAVFKTKDGCERISYRELNQRANQVAGCLIKHGIKTNDLVGVYAQRSIDFLVAILGTLKAGGAYVPFDPNNPKERLEYMIDNANVSVILTQTALKDSLNLPEGCHSVYLDKRESFSTYSANNHQCLTTGDDLAYMIYTSGSTGMPKGALVDHAGALNHIDAEFDLLGFRENGELQASHFLQSAASSSDVSVWQFLAPVVSGGKTVILDDMTDLAKYIELIQSEQVHLIQTAPVVLQCLLDYLDKLPKDKAQLPHLRWLMTIAEACPTPLINSWFTAYPDIPVMNGFGPSEAADDITYHIMRKSLPIEVLSVPIGKPIPNMTMYVLDKYQQLQPLGVAGELCVSGVGVGPGYWNNTERTVESFIVNPFAEYTGIHGERLYRTGDLGCWHADGHLEFMGRLDNQVKIRGFRVELGEIEAVLAKVDGVNDVAVLAHKGDDDENKLAAYIVLKTLHSEIDGKKLRLSLQNSLPEYMIPSSFTFLDVMPLNAADKIDRKALPKPDMSFVLQRYVAPITDVQRNICEIWQEILGIERIGLKDNFFELGGHSILVVRLIMLLRQNNYAVELKAIFEAPTLEVFADQLKSTDDIFEHIVAIKAGGSRKPLFLAPEATGDVQAYAVLAQFMDDDIPIYGLHGDYAITQGNNTVESLAQCYIKEIRHVQEKGPYRISGWSAGGELAYEIAKQLLEAGDGVEFLGIIDCILESEEEDVVISGELDDVAELSEEDFAKDMEVIIAEIKLEGVFDFLKSYLEDKYDEEDPDVLAAEINVISEYPTAELMLSYCRNHESIEISLTDDEIMKMVMFEGAMGHYRPKPLSLTTEIHYFASDTLAKANGVTGWENMGQSALHVDTIGGDHWTMILEPEGAKKLAKSMSQILGEIDNRNDITTVAFDLKGSLVELV
ncbi:MAG: amino acid adenylation domain-containing protein [Alteromonadaceae bacterium]|jgi:amino acid adenylation domain-containing protein